ncbi:unnamed protein product [Linum trigynum]|uniref:F-box domain-containing protein n=1 Tax=Linum trigynum TaxID=586398 RepID=A0AAV2G7S1_9ROSI
MSQSIPPELIADILCRLPTRTLARSRCVSKQWREIIDDFHFTKRHLQHSIHTNSNRRLFIQIDHFAGLKRLKCCRPGAPFRFSDDPNFGGETSNTHLFMGSCHGLLCFHLTNTLADFILVNPSTSQRHYVNNYLQNFSLWAGAQLAGRGFGYDPITHDYKAVRIGSFNDQSEPRAEIYSLGARSRKVVNMPYLPFGPHRMGVSAGGGLHWIGGRCDDLFGPRVIVSLDLGSDEFYELPQPEFGDQPFILTIGALGSWLCVCAAYEDDERLDVWAMEEPGKKGKGRCWNRLYSIRDAAVGRRWALALGFWEGRILFMLDRSGFAWYDPSKERVDVVEVDGPPEDVYFDAVYCLESLVKPFVWKVEGKKQAKQRNEKKITWRKKEVFLMVTYAGKNNR